MTSAMNEHTRLHLGYVTSGRLEADMKRDEALSECRLASLYVRIGCPYQAGIHFKRARKVLAEYRWFRERIIR